MPRALLVLVFMFPLSMRAAEGVILLHGLYRTGASMGKMASALEAEGYVVENVDYPSRTASTAVLADEVIAKALADAKLSGCDKIHFVTHSMGGILVRSFFSRHADCRLGRVVMLGPPNQGSEVVDRLGKWKVFKLINGPAGDELGTTFDSTVNRLGPVKFPLGVIAGDRSINWINSLMIPGKDDGKVSIERTRVEGMTEQVVVHTAHPFMMKNKTVIALTVRFLKTGTFG